MSEQPRLPTHQSRGHNLPLFSGASTADLQQILLKWKKGLLE